MPSPSVAIIILNWNGLSDTLECLESVFKNNYPNYSVIVVDNGSELQEGDPNLRMACESTNNTNHPLIFIQNKTNLGFAEGNNVGIRRAIEDGAEYIFTLNNDTVVDPEFLTEAMNEISEKFVFEELRPGATRRSACATSMAGEASRKQVFQKFRTGIVATTMLKYHDRTRIDSIGHDLLTCGDSIPRGRGDLFSSLQPTTYFLQPVLGACAGAALYSVAMLRQIGLFDADFFLNYEDADLSLRAIVQGWRVVHCPKSIIYHKGNVSIGKIKDTAYRIRSQRNMLWAYFHNIPFPVLLLNLPWMIIRDLLAIILSVITFQFTITKIFILSRWQVVRSIPLIMKKRRLVLSRQRISSWWIWKNQKSWIPVYWKYLTMSFRAKLKGISFGA